MAFCQDSPREALLGTGLPLSPFSSRKSGFPLHAEVCTAQACASWYGWPACVGLWNSLQAKDRAGDRRGREGAGEQDPHRASGDTARGRCFLMTLSVTTHVPGLSGGVLAKSFPAAGDKPKIAGTAAGHAGLWRHCPEPQACPSGVSRGKPSTSPLVMGGPSPSTTLAGALAGVGGVSQGGGNRSCPSVPGAGRPDLTTPPNTLPAASGEGNGAPCSTGGSVSFDLGLALDWCVPP